MSLRIPIQFAILSIALLAVLQTSAQQIDISLHVTAVPDSFEVRARSTGATFTAVPSAVFTIRWGSAAGGIMSNGDIASNCDAYSLVNFGGVIELFDHNYFVVILDMKWNMEACPITSLEQPIGGFRIRELNGCRNVELVQNAFTYLSNFDYYFSVGGIDVTGDITSGPISSGDCAPCEPPEIMGSGASLLPVCGSGDLDLWVEALGSSVDHAWYAPGSLIPFHFLPAISIENGVPGTYLAVVSNQCGADSAFIQVMTDPDGCIPPLLDTAWYEQLPPPSNNHIIQAIADGTCLTYTWSTSSGVNSSTTTNWLNLSTPIDHFSVVVSNECGTDSSWALADPNVPCITPTITSLNYADTLWYSTNTGSFYDLVLHGAITGNYLTLSWILPNGTSIVGAADLHLFNTPSGTYTLIASNPCGSDTVSVEVDIGPCILPEVTWIQVLYDTPCIPGAISLDAGLTGPSPKTYSWYDPNGVLISTSPAGADIDDPEEGWYVFVGSNPCGSVTDSIEVFFGTDTTGCVPPQILSLTSNAPICGGDTLILEAEVAVGEGCVIYDWFGSGVIDTQGPITTAPGGTGNNYGLQLSNACGSTSLMIFPTIYSTHYFTQALCGPTGPVELASLTSSADPEGMWVVNGEQHTGVYDPAIDTSGHYLHYNGMGCLVYSMELHEWPGVNAGTDTAITVCSNSDPVPLFPFLGGDPDPGGFWTWGLSSMSGIYDPVIHTTNNYRYHVTNLGCSAIATVHVTEIQAIPWYSDQDGDGFGDPAEMIMECDQPDGTVADASDDCPLLFGLIGNDCDDGLSTTIDDVITADCECVGELTTGLGEIGTSATLIWPNPNSGDRIFVQFPFEGRSVTIEITDAVGRIVHRSEAIGVAKPLVIEMERRLNAGSYFVKIISGEHMLIEKLVIER